MTDQNSANRSRSAIIVGGGIGGLTAALALEQIGWRVEIFEKATALKEVGAAVSIAPNAAKALRHLGLGEQLAVRGERLDGLEVRLRQGRQVTRLPGSLIERRYNAGLYSLHRAELHEMLLDSLSHTTLHTGHRATGVATGPDTATVDFLGPNGPVKRTAQLVVAADGVHSRLRQALFPQYPGPDYAGYTVWRGIVPESAGVKVDPLLSETWGRGARFGVTPINDGRVYWYAFESIREGSDPSHPAPRFTDWHAPIPALLAATPPHTLLRNDVHYLKAALPGFVHGRVVLLGDAAHAVTPDIGQGACLAIEDGVVLAHALAHTEVDDGLAAYDTARRPRTQQLAQSSGRIGRFLQTRNRATAAVRNVSASILPPTLGMRSIGAAYEWTPPVAA